MKKLTKIKFNKWEDFYYELDALILGRLHIERAVTSLYKFLKLHYVLEPDYLILIQFKVKLDQNQIRSISYLQMVKFSEFNELLEIFIEF